jgi:hypothetical protein
MILLPVIGAAGLTDATSNVGEFSAACPKATQDAKTTKPALMTARSICGISFDFTVIYDEPARRTLGRPD